jgi:hypothetical protein
MANDSHDARVDSVMGLAIGVFSFASVEGAETSLTSNP